MKNLLLALSIFLSTNIASPNTTKKLILMRSKCDIVYDNIYNYCVSHEYSACEAQGIAAAAFTQCKSVSIQ